MEISITGVGKVKERIAKYAKLERDCYILAKQLCKVGEPIIKAAHGGHASVYIEPTDNGYCIKADGDHRLLIVEFGAGDAAGIMASEYDEVPSVVRPGSWSEEHAQMYSRYGFWVFGGQILHEVEPNPSFYYAYQAMVEALPKIAKEVFGE